MTLFEIVAIYTALNLLLLVYLSFRVIGVRRANKIGLGDGGNDELLQRVRVHGNFTEYTPMALIGLFLMAGLAAAPLWLHGLGAALTLGRVLHAFGLSKNKGPSNPRVAGMLITFAVLLTEAGYLLFCVFA